MDLASTRISFSRLSKFFAVDNAMPISINRKYAVDNVPSSKLVTLEAVSKLRAASFELQLSRIPSTACDKHHARLAPEPSTTSNLTQDKKRITFTNALFYLQDRLGTGEISIVTFNNQYDLQITLILIWIL